MAGVVGGLSLFGLQTFEPSGTFTMFDGAFYLAFHRLGWSLALAWLIFASINQIGGNFFDFLIPFVNKYFLTGPINGFLSWEFFQPLAKLSYGVYLSHVTVLFYRLGIIRTNIYFNLPEVVSKFLITYRLFSMIIFRL